MTEIVAHLLTVGDELLTGDVVDTNTAELAQLCRSLGILVERAVSVRDQPREIADALDRARRADLCLVTGGLGPTSDDRTAEAIAAAAGVPLVLDPEAERLVRAAVARMAARPAALSHRSMAADRLRQLATSPENLKQAWLPTGARPIVNESGTAPGFHLRLPPTERGNSETRVISTPGVPSELRAMLPAIAELLRGWFGGRLRPVSRRVYRTFGRESVLAPVVEQRVASAIDRGAPPVALHYRACGPEVLIILERTGAGGGLEQFDGIMGEALASSLYGIGAADLPTRLVRVLREHGLWLAAAEACSGGGLGQQLVAVPGASRCVRGALVPYDDAVKVELLGVERDLLHRHGAVSAEVAAAMAEGVRRRLVADIGLAITGIAGPGGGTADKPVGTVDLAVSADFGRRYRRVTLPGDRAAVQHGATLWGLKLLWDLLVESERARVFDLALPSGSALE